MTTSFDVAALYPDYLKDIYELKKVADAVTTEFTMFYIKLKEVRSDVTCESESSTLIDRWDKIFGGLTASGITKQYAEILERIRERYSSSLEAINEYVAGKCEGAEAAYDSETMTVTVTADEDTAAEIEKRVREMLPCNLCLAVDVN
ncbi:MAG: hypothetical protein LUG52_06600 [Clostridia bacterium]|nr:hypothetical protein [Clostridia bacterium]